jgi:phage terminase small subunit
MVEQEEIIEVQLTDKQEKFCYEYCLDFNATRAAISAGYSENSARSQASQLLTKLNIQNRIKEMQDNLAQTAGISRLKVLLEHQKLAFSSIAHLHNTWIERKEFELLTDIQKECIQEIDTKTQHKTVWEYNEDTEKKDPVDYTVEYVKIKLYDKQKALDSISKMLGFDAPLKTEIDIKSLSLPTIILKRHSNGD